MGNTIDSFFTGFVNSIGKLFGSPLDFLSGKSCSAVCGSTWDFFCYIENFCVANLVKMAIFLILSYIFLLFIYMLYKVGFWRCISHGLCRTVWACISCWFSSWYLCCTFLCSKLLSPNPKRHRKHRHEGTFHTDRNTSAARRLRGCGRRDDRLRKSLRPTSHRVRVGLRKDDRSGHYYGGCDEPGASVHGVVRVSRTSRFVRKGSKYRRRVRR